MREPVVTVRVQTFEVLVRAALVREVLGECVWTPLPGARSEIPGVTAWSGRAVALLDLAQLVPGLRRLGPADRRPRTAIVQAGSSIVAIPADEVSEVWRAAPDAFRSKELAEFPLARVELVQEERALPVFEPDLLLTALGVGT
jgi:chemotaxis signal transduction protein